MLHPDVPNPPQAGERPMSRKIILVLAALALASASAACDGVSPTGPVNIEIDPDPTVLSQEPQSRPVRDLGPPRQ